MSFLTIKYAFNTNSCETILYLISRQLSFAKPLISHSSLTSKIHAASPTLTNVKLHFSFLFFFIKNEGVQNSSNPCLFSQVHVVPSSRILQREIH